MDERDACLERGGLCDQGKVHDFLDRVRRQQAEACGSGRHDIAVIAEDRKRMSRDRPG
jgi:hypothetical protein